MTELNWQKSAYSESGASCVSPASMRVMTERYSTLGGMSTDIRSCTLPDSVEHPTS